MRGSAQPVGALFDRRCSLQWSRCLEWQAGLGKTEGPLFGGGVARPQIFSNLGHGGGAFDEFAALGCFPADLGFSLEFGESPLIDVVLLVEQVDACRDDV